MTKNKQGFIETLTDDEVIIFGSNTAGKHYGGLAKQCVEDFGAVMGKGFGPQGSSYAVPTLDCNFERLPLYIIELYLKDLVDYALSYPRHTFYLTAIGTGIAGFSKEEMESIMPTFPSNVINV